MTGPIAGRRLSDLKARPKSLPTRTVKLCLDQEVLAQIQALDNERADVLLNARRGDIDAEGNPVGPARRMGESLIPPRVAEIDAEIDALQDRMRASEGDLLLRAVSPQEWQGWKDAYPAREGNKSDDDMAYGLCDSTALLADLARYAAAWDGETFGPTDWGDYFAALVAPGDMFELCRQVVQMHEARVSVPGKRSSASSGTPTSGSASA